MSGATTPSVVQQIGSLFDGGSVVGLTDCQLIERFNNHRRDATGEAAFTAVVKRHGPLIMHLCRQILDDHHAEDAFQAVFLVLACKKMKPSAIGHARSDDSGRFEVDAPRTSSSRHHRMGAVAIAPGYGAGWVEFDPGADRLIANISLWPEQVIRGRLFDLVGQPVQGVEVKVQSMGRVTPENRTSPRGEGPSFWWDPGIGLPAWPKSAISDRDGRFTVRGVGRDLRVFLMIDDPRFARQLVPIKTDGSSELRPVALVPARIITGRITDADAGTPIPHAQVRVLSYASLAGGTVNEFETDAEGRFRANPMLADRYEVYRREHGFARRAGRPPLSRPCHFRLRPDAGRRKPRRQHHAAPGHDRDWPDRRA